MKKKIIISLIFCAVVVVIGIFLFSKKNQLGQKSDQLGVDLEYHNVTRNFSLRYPKELEVKEFDEGDTTYTIVFSNPAAATSSPESFQIFFTPYLGDTITQSRILEDVPSGNFTEPTEIVLGDGTHAIVFFSTQDAQEMREVWFIHDGYLFEVTTFKNLDSWLSQIMQSWKFLSNPSAGS